MANLNTLAAELILRIIDFVDPGSHLDFALTTRFVAGVSKDVLEHHQECHRNMRRSIIWTAPYKDEDDDTDDRDSDAVSNFVPDFLDRITQDPVAAWHFRELDIHDAHEERQTEFDKALSLEEIAHADRVLDAVLGPKLDAATTATDRNPQPLRLHAARARLEQGRTRVKQALWVSTLCRRLKTLAIHLHEPDTPTDHDDDEQESCEDFFGSAIFYLYAINREAGLPARAWPESFQSIRNVVLKGLPNGVASTAALPFFLLPSISAINIHRMYLDDPLPGQGMNEYLRRASFESRSPVRTIILDDAFDDTFDDASQVAVDALLKTTAVLRHVVFRNSDFDSFDGVVRSVSLHHGECLETLISCGYSTRQRPHNAPRYDWSNFHHLTAVRVLTVDVLDMIPASARRSAIENKWGNETTDEFLERFVGSIPPTLEVLILQDTPAQRLNDKEMYKVGDALMRLIDGNRCPKLSTIYADNFEAKMRDARSRWGKHTDGGWLKAAQACAEERGITMFTQNEEGETDRYLESLCAELLNADA